MVRYRIHRVFENIPEIIGLELTRRGQQWEGPYYLNGDRHPYRRDKMKVFIGKDAIWIAEEGGECISITTWLQRYGGCSDYWDAIKMLEGRNMPIKWDGIVRNKVLEVKYVGRDVLEAARRYDLRKNNLFKWMCGLFPEERVREAWNLYNVTTDSHGNAVFWYVDQSGKILYDKRILYKPDGHRDKSFSPGRQFRVADGYSGRCYFGANVEREGRKCFIVESEKSAILGYLYYGRVFLATGGKSNLRDVEPDMMLCPDLDARIEWDEKGEVWPWWEKWGIPIDQIPDHADIGDMIEFKQKQKI